MLNRIKSLAVVGFLLFFSTELLAQKIPGLKYSEPPIIPGEPSEFGLLPRPTDDSKLQPSGITTKDLPPAAWDWRANGGMTSVKNQNPYGACWAHAALGGMESMVLINQGLAYDFSEFNLVACNPFGTNCDSGGNDFYAAVFLTRNGTVMESCDPYSQCSGSIVCNSCTKNKTPLVWKKLANNLAEIKDAVYHIGPAYASIYANSAFQSLAPGAVYYYTGPEDTNHAVMIVGWDDSKAHAGGTGAWLIKNSWGTGWSDNGYGWVAYGSARIGSNSSIYSEYRSFYPDEKVYFYDEYGCDYSVGFANPAGWGMVQITPTADGVLDRVDFWTVGINASYRIRVYDNFDGSNLTGLLASQDGSCDKVGYYSVKLSSPPNVTAADPIFIAIEFTVPGSIYPIPIDSSGPTETNKCYVSPDGSDWYVFNDYDITIRGRVVPRPVDTDGDGILDYIENSWCTSPADPDSDDDGLCDGNATIMNGGTVVCAAGEDLNGNGVVDAGETDPCNPDSDFDRMPDGWEDFYGLDPLNPADAAADNDTDNRRNLDEYLRMFNPTVAEPNCGEGAYCVADSDGNGIVEVPDLSALGVLLGGTPASWTQVIPQNGDQMDLDGNGIIEVPDYSLLLSVLVQNLGGNLPGQPDAVNLESSPNVTISNGQWTKITVNLTSQATAGAKKRSGYGVIFYVSSSTGGGAGEFWGGDKASVTRPGGRYCVTGRMIADEGRAEIWFKAASPGVVYVQAEVPASAPKYTQAVQLLTPVEILINGASDTWLPTTTTSAPVARYYHTAVWTGTEMIVWGGSNGGYLNSGARYDPATDSWTATTTTGAPTARYRHTAVWSGTEMIVWGGHDGNYANTGSRYNPSTNGWTVMTTTNAPTARYFHTAVWTGTEMIVWGGYYYDTSAHYYNTGGRYNPISNTWAATSTTNPPTVRDLHTAVYTGTKMIVWGGYDGTTNRLNTGGRYDPIALDANAWTATSLGANLPTARDRHTAVWTGSRMIVWGGADASYLYSTGGRYDPVSDTWAETTLVGDRPSPRYYHSAIWTGTEMIIWGGLGGSYFNNGSSYNPTGNYWTAITTAGAPSIRGYHRAIWSGFEMIIWGGWDGTYLGTGGRYYP